MGYNIDNIIVNLKKQIQESGGSGTSDYSQLTNKPQINGVTLSGNKSLSDLGIVGNPEESATAGNLTKLQIGSNIYNVPSGGSAESVSVTADGIKTTKQLIRELAVLVDFTKVNGNSYIAIGDSFITAFNGLIVRNSAVEGSAARFSGIAYASSNMANLQLIDDEAAYLYSLVATVESSSPYTVTWVRREENATVPTTGDTITLYY